MNETSNHGYNESENDGVYSKEYFKKSSVRTYFDNLYLITIILLFCGCIAVFLAGRMVLWTTPKH